MSAWEESEIAALRAEVNAQRGERINWRQVAISVGEYRTPEQCRSKWRRIQGTAKPRAWAVHERSLLRYVVEEQEALGIDWSSIKDFFYGRTAAQCQAEWDRIKTRGADGDDKPAKRKTWDFDELTALMKAGAKCSVPGRSRSAKRGMLYRLRQGGWSGGRRNKEPSNQLIN